MLEVAEGVEYIHSEGIVHGDLRGVGVLLFHFIQLIILVYQRKISFSTIISNAK